jgi:hypothetical protein
MQIRIIASLAVIALFVSACSSVTVRSDFDREYNFQEFTTYRWASGSEINKDDELQKYPLILKRVRNAVDSELSKLGFTELQEGEPDVVMLVHAGTQQKTQVYTTGGGGYGYGWYDPWWGPSMATTTVSQYQEATLYIDMVAWQSKELAWRGIAVGTVQPVDDPDEQTERMNNIVAKVFTEYPTAK